MTATARHDIDPVSSYERTMDAALGYPVRPFLRSDVSRGLQLLLSCLLTRSYLPGRLPFLGAEVWSTLKNRLSPTVTDTPEIPNTEEVTMTQRSLIGYLLTCTRAGVWRGSV
jgi:hypothetical protein